MSSSMLWYHLAFNFKQFIGKNNAISGHSIAMLSNVWMNERTEGMNEWMNLFVYFWIWVFGFVIVARNESSIAGLDIWQTNKRKTIICNKKSIHMHTLQTVVNEISKPFQRRIKIHHTHKHRSNPTLPHT